MAQNVTLPELGENVEGGNVAKVLVAVGDTVKKDQPLLEVETDKAVVEVPASAAGVVKEIKAKEGSSISVGDIILVLDESGGGGGAKAEEAPKKEKKAEKTKDEEASKPVKEEKKPEPKDEKLKEEKPAEDEAPEEEPEEKPAADKKTKREPEPQAEPRPAKPDATVTAAPSVRRFARQIGIDLTDVEPEEGTNRVTIDAVKAYARTMNTEGRAAAAPAVMDATMPLPNFEKWGHVEREAMSTIRRRTAERLAMAWNTIPHVTQNDKADATDLEAFRKRYGKRVEAQGAKLTATAILVKLLAAALKRFPQFNVSIDVENSELIQKYYYNIGVAVDTDYGLLVPVLKDVDRKNVTDIAVELNEMAERARQRKLSLDEMQGGCCTVTNLGGIGGTGFSPIVNPPEVAILGVSRSRIEPVFIDGAFQPRTMLPLSLSYDHRVIDGADAARFTRWICDAIEQPLLTLLEG